MTTATDNFTGTDGTAITTYNANYAYQDGGSAHNILEIHSNGCRIQADVLQSTGNFIYVTRSDLSFGNDQWAEVTLTDVQTNGNCHLSVRTGAGTLGYHLYVEDSQWRIYAPDDATQIGSTFSHTSANGDVVRLSVVGTAVKAYLNGSVVISGTSSAVASGKPAFGGQGNQFVSAFYTFDNLTMSDVFGSLLQRPLPKMVGGLRDMTGGM